MSRWETRRVSPLHANGPPSPAQGIPADRGLVVGGWCRQVSRRGQQRAPFWIDRHDRCFAPVSSLLLLISPEATPGSPPVMPGTPAVMPGSPAVVQGSPPVQPGSLPVEPRAPAVGLILGLMSSTSHENQSDSETPTSGVVITRRLLLRGKQDYAFIKDWAASTLPLIRPAPETI